MKMSIFFTRLALNSLGIMLVASVVPGIELKTIIAAIAAGLIFGLVNALVKPILILLTLPLSVVTFGLFLLIVNGLSFWLVAGLVKDFYITNIFSAILGSLIMSFVSILFNGLTQKTEPKNHHVGYFYKS